MFVSNYNETIIYSPEVYIAGQVNVSSVWQLSSNYKNLCTKHLDKFVWLLKWVCIVRPLMLLTEFWTVCIDVCSSCVVVPSIYSFCYDIDNGIIQTISNDRVNIMLVSQISGYQDSVVQWTTCWPFEAEYTRIESRCMYQQLSGDTSNWRVSHRTKWTPAIPCGIHNPSIPHDIN